MTHDDAAVHMQDALDGMTALAPAGASHIAACQECAARWDELCAAERVFENAPEAQGLSAAALARVEAAVMAGLPKPAAQGLAWWLRALWASPVLAAAAAVLWIQVPGSTGGFQGRGSLPQGAAESAPRVRVLCVGPEGVRGEAQSAAMPGVLHCGLSDDLGFTVTSQAGSAWKYLFVVGSQGPDQPRWYHPRPEEKLSVKLPDLPVTDQLLTPVHLVVNHRPGANRVLVIFSQEALSVEAVAEALKGDATHPEAALAASLPGPVLVQQVEVTIP